MHELSVAHSIVTAVDDAAHGSPVERVRVRVGALSGVVADALRFAFDVAAAGSCCDGAELVVDEIPVIVWCGPCNSEQQLSGPLRFRCPVCATPTDDVRGGRDLTIASYTPRQDAEVPA